MALDLGLHTTLDDTVSKLDPEIIAISERITPLLSSEKGKVWELFKTRAKPFETDEYEVYVRNYTAPTVVDGTSGAGLLWDSASATADLPVSSATIDRITIGDVLLFDDEIVVVSAIDRGANTVDVYERGAGETSGAQHYSGSGGSGSTIKVIGNAHREGRVDGEAMAEQTSKVTNYTQLVEEIVDLSHADTDQARKVGRTEPILKAEAMHRVVEDLYLSSIFGTARAPTASIPQMTRGLLGYMRDVSGASKTTVSGSFTETVLRNGLDAVRTAGGTVNAIILSITNKRIANGFTGADQITIDKFATQGGHRLDSYYAEGFGIIPFVVDLDMPNDEVALVNSNFMEKGWKVNDQLRFVKETNTNSRENKETLQGKFGLSVEQIGKSHHLLTAIS